MEEYPKSVERADYTDKQLKYRQWLFDRLERAREQREQEHDEFDGMTYEEYYESNAKAANSYIAPKKNNKDSRVTTGVTEGKVDTIISSLLNLNLEPNIRAFDGNNTEVIELGENMESLIQKSREIETPDWEVKKPLVYKEMLVQGTVFLEEAKIEWKEINKKLKKGFNWNDGIKGKQVWEEKEGELLRECRVKLLAGTNVYLGNVNDFYMDTQPYIFTRDHITYEEAKMLFGEWEMFKHVSPTIQRFYNDVGELMYSDWSLIENQEGFVELIKYYDKPNNEMQILINGVMMLPVGFPMSAVLGKCVYPIAKGDINPVSKFFAYSRSLPAKTKVDQATLDEFYRLFVRKTQKSVAPPLANNTRRELTSKIFDPAQITNDLDANRLQQIGDNNGVTSPEFQMFQLLKSEIDAKSVSPILQGQSPSGSQTATETVELKKQSMNALGLIIWGVVNLEESMSWLRLYNIINTWTEAIDKRVNEYTGKLEEVFAKVQVEGELEDGAEGIKEIEFTNELPEPTQIKGLENIERRKGRNVKKVYISPKLLRETNMNWEIIITPTERDSDLLDRQQFRESIAEGYQLFGIQSFNQEYLKAQWAQKHKLDKNKLFQQQQPVPQIPQEGGMPQMGGGSSQALSQSVRGQMQQTQSPSLNTMVNA